jgi:hypothetical protein
MIKKLHYPSITPGLKQELDHYVREEFGHVPFVQERSWASPDWTVLYYEEDQLATFYNIVERTITADGVPYKVAGINNVITPKAFRGKGYSTRTLRETEAFLFEELKADYGLLLCADALLPFYSRLNWYTINSTLYYDQPSGKQLYDSNIMLLQASGKEKLYPKEINLNGLPW